MRILARICYAENGPMEFKLYYVRTHTRICANKLKFHESGFLARILVTSSPTRPTRRHPREDSREDVACHRLGRVQLATRLPDWSAGGLLQRSAARLSVCRVVLQISRARHARLVADILARCHEDATRKLFPWNLSVIKPAERNDDVDTI